jgi:hypothetical protein
MLFPFQRVCTVTMRLGGIRDRQRTADPMVQITDIVWAVQRMNRVIPWGANCLVTALVSYVLLRRCDHHAELCIGVAQNGNAVPDAHAWIEVSGKIVIGALPDMQGYTLLARLSSEGDGSAQLSGVVSK